MAPTKRQIETAAKILPAVMPIAKTVASERMNERAMRKRKDAELEIIEAKQEVGSGIGAVEAAAASEPGVAFGGEPSGAWVWPEETLCPDGPLAACALVELAADRPLAERAAAVETYPIRRESVTVDKKERVMERVRERVDRNEPAEAVSTLDGVRVERERGWFLVRASGTQPLVRLTAEARSTDAATALLADAESLLAAARAEL